MNNGNNGVQTYISQMGALVEKALTESLAEYGEQSGHYARLLEAMRYSLLAEGKRIRPVFMIAAAQAVGGSITAVLPAACAIEMIHTYSLIHDDLPAMDNDDLRRGKPTNHRVFGEAAAILAGDALLTSAFALLASTKHNSGIEPATLLTVIAVIAEAAGARGMAGGQMLDILAEGNIIDAANAGDEEKMLNEIHTRKTALLIAASLKVGGLIAKASAEQLQALQEYGLNIGLAFQIADDVLDVEGSMALLGKDVGTDERRGKLTYPALYGIVESRRRLTELISRAVEAITKFDEKAEPLRLLAHYIGARQK